MHNNILHLFCSPTNLVMTGQSTSAPLERNTITTAGQRCLSGRSPKNGWRGCCGSFINVFLTIVNVRYQTYNLFFCIISYREQRQKETSKTAVVNSFPKDRDYRREAMQASATPTGSSKSFTFQMSSVNEDNY